ncbi:MAG: hypothetical protein Q8K96_02305 [Rubrivivax sp.]|nr:hypothetical protein [Rubrivivax sp.]
MSDVVALASQGELKGDLTVAEVALLMADQSLAGHSHSQHEAAVTALLQLERRAALATHPRHREEPYERVYFTPYSDDIYASNYRGNRLGDGMWRTHEGPNRPEVSKLRYRTVSEKCIAPDAMAACLEGAHGEWLRAQGLVTETLLGWLEASGAKAPAGLTREALMAGWELVTLSNGSSVGWSDGIKKLNTQLARGGKKVRGTYSLPDCVDAARVLGYALRKKAEAERGRVGLNGGLALGGGAFGTIADTLK